MSSIFSSVFISTLLGLSSLTTSTTITLQSGCNNLNDGLHYIKPLENGGIIPVICSNGYTMLDLSLNFESITSYLSSYSFSRTSQNIITSSINDFVSFRSWWIPSDASTEFTIADNCNECIDDVNNVNGAYYMTNYYFCNLDEYSLNNYCNDIGSDLDDGSFNNYCSRCYDEINPTSDWNKCSALILDADSSENMLKSNDHQKCLSKYSLSFKPSMTSSRSSCSCYKPSQQSVKQYQVNADDLPSIQVNQGELSLDYFSEQIIWSTNDNDNDTSSSSSSDDSADPTDDPTSLNIVYLSQADVISEPYRITEPGTYILLEDITFNFNAPSSEIESDPDFSPNNYEDDGMYFYPPSILDSYSNSYSLGYFAGITIESDDVVIDLSGHQLDMAYPFYLQQRFFSLIEIGNMQFIPGEGINYNNEDEPVYPSNIEIKDGTLGLSSHHGLHGNNVNTLTLTNLVIQNFDVTGFQCNGCNLIQFTESTVGPQNTNIPVLGRYTHARALLPRLRILADNYGSESIQFYNRQPQTIQDLIDRMVNQMDMIYNHVIHGQEYSDSDPEWSSAKSLFINPTGLMDGGSSYGIVLNGLGTSMQEIGANMDGTNDIHLENVEIQGIYNAPLEKFKLTDNNDNVVKLMFADNIDLLAVFDQIHDLDRTRYIGDSYTDLNFAIDRLCGSDDWYYLNTLSVNDGLRNLIFSGDNTLISSDGYFNIHGSTDIQLQSIKGAIGIRADGVSKLKIETSSIHNILNYGAAGSTLSGEYSVASIYNEIEDVQAGYTGNRAQGLMGINIDGTIASLEIYDISSESGASHGIVTYGASNMGVENIQVRNIQAGSRTTQNDVESLNEPNYIPMACSFELRGESILYTTSDRLDLGDITGHFIIGYDLCTSSTDSEHTRAGQCEWCYNKNADYISSSADDDHNDGLLEGQMLNIESDCTNLEDGLQYILPDRDIGTVIPVRCQAGWTMLDGSLTPNLVDYFTSYTISHRDDTLMLPNTDEHTSWRNWFIPADDSTLFRVASTCTECLGDDNPTSLHGDNTAYYSTGDYLCFYIRKTGNTCDYSDVYCNICDDPDAKLYDQPYDPDDLESDTYPMWEQCKYVRASADDISSDNHYYCTHREPFVWPALSNDGTGCTCYKPSAASVTTHTIPLIQAVNQFETAHNTEYTALESQSEYLYIELYQSDFTDGTYRITQPGTYRIMEDITFDFNAPSADIQADPEWSPNDFNADGDVWWWPRKDQDSDYPGAATFYNPFTLGYFAGISVETSDVIIDLNTFTLAMSYPFYVQQRFFSLIELANRPFAPGKGAANWGWITHYATNVVVRNGHLGLTSHHCLHGNFLNNVLVTDVTMSNFDVAGFGCGQCVKVTLNNLDVGPQHQTIPVLGRYTHARSFLPRLQYLMDNYGDWEVPFWDRTPTINELGQRLLNQMDMTYNYVVNNIEPDADDDEWLEAKKLFINAAGYQDASASYGIVFAGGAAVSAIGTRIENEGDITITNVAVHGLRSHVMEKYKVYGAATTVTMRGFFRDTIDWEAITDNFDAETINEAKYVGNAYEDLLFAVVLKEDLDTLGAEEWSFLYTTQIEQFVKDWVMTGDAETSDLERYLDIHCGTDIQVHSVKGAIGLRVDGADNLNIDGLSITDIISTTDLGSMRCGEYDAPAIAGEEPFIQPGFNGHRAHGLTTVYTNGVLKDVTISDISSDYGSVYGIRIFDGSDIQLQGDINIQNLNAGTQFNDNQIDMKFMIKSTTNPLPQACGFMVYSDPDNVNYDDDITNIYSSNVVGYRDCVEHVIRTSDDDAFDSSIVGDCDECIIKDMFVVSAGAGSNDKSNLIPLPNISPFSVSIMIIFAITLIFVMYRYKYPKLYKFINKEKENLLIISSENENSPLIKKK